MELKFVTVISIITLVIGFYIGKYYEHSKIPDVVEYACAEKKTVGAQYYDEKVHIGLSDGREYTLARIASPTGERYSNMAQTIIFWNKGDSVLLQEGSQLTYSNCLEP